MQVIRDFDGKGVTVVADNGNSVVVRAGTFLNLCTRSDGGVTIWGDGRPKSETIRTDKRGVVLNPAKKKRKPRKK